MSMNSLQSVEMERLCKCLRADFKVPSARTLARRQDELDRKCMESVDEDIAGWENCILGMDGWEDNQRCEVLAVTAWNGCVEQRPLLVHFERIEERATGPHMADT